VINALDSEQITCFIAFSSADVKGKCDFKV
jgi:hypothetical protein